MGIHVVRVMEYATPEGACLNLESSSNWQSVDAIPSRYSHPMRAMRTRTRTRPMLLRAMMSYASGVPRSCELHMS